MSSDIIQKCKLYSLGVKLPDTHLRVTAIIKDINNLRGALDDLETLNEAGREKLDELRDCIEQLRDLGYEENNTGILRDAEKHRLQMVSTQQAFWTASISKLQEIRTAKREILLAVRRNASKAGKRNIRRSLRSLEIRSSALLSQYSSKIEQMRSNSQQMFDITQRSTTQEPQDLPMADKQQKPAKRMDQSHRPKRSLRKYRRRESSEKILTAVGLTLFLVCVIYVIYRRLF